MAMSNLEATRMLMDLLCGVGDGFSISTDILNDYDIRDIILSVVGKIDINIDDDDFTLLMIPGTNIALSMETKGDRIEIF